VIKKVNTTENQFTIPSMWYYDKNFLDQEKKEIFLKEWQLIGSHSQVKNTGDVLVAEIANNPIIVSRQEDNTLKGFYNVCQHRGGPLVYENCSLSKLQCKYHGWVYDLNGNLKSARGFKNSELNINDYNLTPVNVTEWMGQIFVNLSNDPADLCNQIDEIKTLISPIDFSNYTFKFRESYKINCNWKVYMDNFLEGFHIPFVHPELNKVIDYKSYKTEIYDRFSLQWCPLDSELSPYGKSPTPEENKAFYFTIFPNIILNIAPGRLQTNIIEPKDSKTCIVHFDYHFDDPEKANIKQDAEFSEIVQQEDILICENVQKGLESNGYDQGKFSPLHEQGVLHFQSLVRNSLNL
jgi:choline monooxygenase